MMNRKIFVAATICSIAVISAALMGCASSPQDSAWNLLARGEGERAMQYFLGDVDVNDSDNMGRTPLHFAAKNRDPFLASFFISLGARVDALDHQRRTPLAISTAHLDAPTARVLAAAGANIHHPIPSDNSPALVGVQPGNEEFLSALLNSATVADVDFWGRSILHLAAEAGNVRAVNAILSVGAPIALQDRQGRNALDIAFARHDSRDHAEVAERLVLAGAISENPLNRYFSPGARISNYNVRLTDGMAPLHYIARMGYIGYLDFVLERGADVNIQNASGATPLHEAARSGNIRVMETLLNHGANVNTQDASGNSVLHIAIPPETHFTALNLLLARGANVNLRDGHGSSPLHVAVVLNRSNAIVSTLLTAGVDVTIRDAEGKTALYLAVENERINLVPLLLSHGSDIFAADNNGVTPFKKALLQNTSLVFAMINRETVLRRDSGGNSMLHITVMAGGNTDVMSMILDLSTSALVNARNYAGDTALTVAVRMNEATAGTLLLQRGADIFAVNSYGETPLSLTFPPAPPAGNPADLRRWMLTPQTLSARDGLGNTALHYAAQWRLDHWIPLLVQAGAHTEAANATGETALFAAVRVNSPSTIRALVSSGSLLQARDMQGNSALHAAVRWHTIGSAETLIDLGLDINSHALNGRTPLHDSIRFGMPHMQVLLLQRGANIEVRDTEGNTPLMETVLAGSMDALQRFSAAGADPNTRNLRGDTPLHVAVATERLDIANLLLSRGVSIHARNAQGRTPFHGALTGSPVMLRMLLGGNRLYSVDDFGASPLHVAVQERVPATTVRMIVDLGARLSSVDAEGRTPLRLAVEMQLWESARVLADSGSDVFLAARDGRSAAEISLGMGDPAIRALFSGGAINLRDPSGNTILHYAARHGDPAVISQLLSMGAFREAQNIAAERPVDIALRWNHQAAAAILN